MGAGPAGENRGMAISADHAPGRPPPERVAPRRVPALRAPRPQLVRDASWAPPIVATAGAALPWTSGAAAPPARGAGRCPPCCSPSCWPPAPGTGSATATRPAPTSWTRPSAPFYGCLPMALLAVGGGTLVGRPGRASAPRRRRRGRRAVHGGHGAGLAAAVAVPYLMVVRHRPPRPTASPVWLLPLVAPMVSAAVGPLLVPELPAGSGAGGAAAGLLRDVRAEAAGHAGGRAAGLRPAGPPAARCRWR